MFLVSQQGPLSYTQGPGGLCVLRSPPPLSLCVCVCETGPCVCMTEGPVCVTEPPRPLCVCV